MIQLIGTTTDTVFVDSLLIGNLGYCYKVSAVDTVGFRGMANGKRVRLREERALTFPEAPPGPESEVSSR